MRRLFQYPAAAFVGTAIGFLLVGTILVASDRDASPGPALVIAGLGTLAVGVLVAAFKGRSDAHR